LINGAKVIVALGCTCPKINRAVYCVLTIAIPAMTTALAFPATKPQISGFLTALSNDVFQKRDFSKVPMLLSVFPAQPSALLA